MQTTRDKIFSFDEFEVDVNKRLLLKKGKSVSLNPKTFDLLLTLIEGRGEVLLKNDLLDKVWENQFVEENNLTVHVAALRKALGETKNEHRFIVTVPGKGYRFVAEVRTNSISGNNNLIIERTKADFNKQNDTNENESLIGREREIAVLRNLLAEKNFRLITLTGAGGCGKTTLAQFAASEVISLFPDGLYFVELASISNQELISPTVAKTLGIAESGGKSIFECLKDFLAEKKILLVLDNIEQLIPAANSFVEDLLASSDLLKILVTSRTALKLKNEWEIAVTPLTVPPMQDFYKSKEELNEYAAVRLFVLRAKSVRPSFDLTEENAGAIAEICCRLDGLPLAVELAAARIKLLAPKEILARLENSLKLLSGGARNLSARQQTMYGAIQWSYELLDDEEKILFRRVSVFSGGFTVKAAENILDEKKLERRNFTNSNITSETEILDLLASLVDNNLIEIKEQKDGSIRLKMLEVIREFALEYLKKSGELNTLQKNHACFFLKLAEKAEPNLTAKRSVKWLEKLEIEINNIRAALDWSLHQEPEITGRIMGATRYFWSNHNYLTEGRKWLEKSLKKSVNVPVKIRFKLLNALGQFARNQGDYTASKKFNELGLKEGRTANDLQQIVISLHGLAAVATRQGDFETAQKINEEQLKIVRQSDYVYEIATTLSALSDVLIAKGETETARPLIEESLTLSKQIGNSYILCINLINLGTVEYNEENYETAYRNFAKSLLTAQDLGNKTLISCSLDGLAAVAVSCGKAEQAAHLAGAAENLRKSIGYEIEPTERIFRDSYITKVRNVLDEKSFNDAFEKGLEFSLKEGFIPASKLNAEDFINAESSEIIIEKHSFERIIIEEEIEKDES